MTEILMPKATAVWLVDNTGLSFAQIADLCGLHALEVQAIADGEVATGMAGQDPIARGILTQKMIEEAEADPSVRLKPLKRNLPEPVKRAKGPRYTPVSKRGDKPNAIAWLLKEHGELTDAQIVKLIGTTKSTIQKIRERTHWDMANIRPANPVMLDLCRSDELTTAVNKARKAAGREPLDAATINTGIPDNRPEDKQDNEAEQPAAPPSPLDAFSAFTGTDDRS